MAELIPAAGPSALAPAAPERRLTAAEFQHLAEVPAAAEWFANLDNPRTRRAYQGDLQDFCQFVGITAAEQFRAVTRAHVLAWRQQLEQRGLSGASIRRKLAALASLFDHLLENNAVAGGNPVHGVKRPRQDSSEGKTPALGDHPAKALLAVLLYHGLRREEAAQLSVQDIHERRGIKHLRIHGKGNKLRYLPLHPIALERLHDYLEASGHHHEQPRAPLFQALRGRRSGQALGADGISTLGGHYARQAGSAVDGLGVHGLRATAATNALENEADIAKVQQWLGHANISTTRLYDKRQSRPEDSPTYRVRY